MSKLYDYDVDTRFGVIVIKAYGIEDARRDARQRFGVRAKTAVRRHHYYELCEACDSKPCCCPES